MSQESSANPTSGTASRRVHIGTIAGTATCRCRESRRVGGHFFRREAVLCDQQISAERFASNALKLNQVEFENSKSKIAALSF
jgi:hypothetical protein